jgi:hypothetical protein
MIFKPPKRNDSLESPTPIYIAKKILLVLQTTPGILHTWPTQNQLEP